MGDHEWTNTLVIQLMKEYAKRPELWDTNNELYRVQTARYEAWSDLAGLFECDIAELRKKLNSIFASHRREKAKVRLGGKSTWFLYPYMKFLPTHLQNMSANNDNTETVQQEEEEEEIEKLDSEGEDNDNDEQEEILREEIIIKSEPVVTEYVSRPRKRFRYPAQTRKPRLTKFKKIVKEPNVSNGSLDSKVLETLSLLRSSHLTRKKDECDSFGEYIAVSLRKHDDRTQSMIKQAINNILFEQEMKKYSVGQYTMVISGVEENPLILSDQSK